eukprot:jgi/Tetstr1/420770/TSEL_011847.t1
MGGSGSSSSSLAAAGASAGVAAAVGNCPPAPVSDDGGSKEDDVMGVGEDPVGEDGMDIDAPAWPPAGVEAADEGVIRQGDPGDFYMKIIAKKFRGLWHYGVITGVVTEWVLEDYGGVTRWRAVFEDGDTVDLMRSEEEEEAARLRAWESSDVPGSDTDALTFAVMKCSAHVKSKNSNNSDDIDWQLLHDIMPAGFTWGGMAVPRSHKAMRKCLREALVLLDGPGIRKVAVLVAPAHMSSANAADLGVDAGELVVAGIHARSHDAARAFAEASHTAARVASWNASLTWRNSALTAAVVGQGTAR